MSHYDTMPDASLTIERQTVSILGSFVLAMVLNPEIQQKAQLEIDDVCGRRFPALSDRPCLPYLDAILKEALRWHPVIPLSLFASRFRCPRELTLAFQSSRTAVSPTIYIMVNSFRRGL